jgi:DNA-directed RNA polymerase subunit K/omega
MNTITIVKKENRITLPILYKYEYVNALGTRAAQIANGAKIMIKNGEDLRKIKTSIEIAEEEIKLRTCPLIIVRPLPNNKEEHWDINELELLNYD